MIALRYARARNGSRFLNFITIFSIGGITLGVTALIIVLSVMNGFESQLKQRILGAVPHVMVEKRQSLTQWQPLIEQLKSADGVLGVSPINLSQAMLQGRTKLNAIMLHGIDPVVDQQHNPIASSLQYGEFTSLQAGKYNIILGTRLAQQLDLRIGDKVRVLSAQRSQYGPMGRIPNQRKFTVSALFEMQSEADAGIALIHITDSARLLRYSKDSVGALRLFLTDAFSSEALMPKISLLINNKDGSVTDDYQLSSWRKTYGDLFTAVSMEKNMMWLMLSLIIGVAAFNIVSALVILVTEKQTDIAILSTLGLTRAKIALIFIAQGTINGIFGTLLGLVFGLTISIFLNDILDFFGLGGLVNPLDPSMGMPILIVPSQIVMLVIATVLVTLLATLYPSFKAGKTDPAEALKHE